MFESLSNATSSLTYTIFSYTPKLLAGLIILMIGIIIASLLKDMLSFVLRYAHVERWLQKAGLEEEEEHQFWPGFLAELLRWTTIIIFLMSAVEVWEIPKVADVINQLLLFIPNVVLAIVIGWVGLMVGKFTYKVVRHGVKGLEKKESVMLATISRYLVLFFTGLVVLTQLGIAADLIKILFTGIVGMLSLAGGLAFGLGGKDEARDLLKKLRQRLTSPKE